MQNNSGSLVLASTLSDSVSMGNVGETKQVVSRKRQPRRFHQKGIITLLNQSHLKLATKHYVNSVQMQQQG